MNNWRATFLFTLVFLLISFAACKSKSDESQVSGLKSRINDIQVIGSHNSYKKAIEPVFLKLMQVQMANSYEDLQYAHIPISEQLEDYGLRNLEIDVVYDPQGGRFAKPLGIELLKQQGIEPLDYDNSGLMQQPGFKVMHVPDIDFRTNCLTLNNCLEEIKNWSDTHPNHLPICITINAKSEQINQPGFVKLLPFTIKGLDSLDAEILSVIPEDRIIKPDDVRGKHKTLEEAVIKDKWPELERSRGKFIFVLDEFGQKRKNYLEGHPSLKGRLMFVTSRPGNPEAAFMIINDPIRNQENIKELVKQGYLVRTRADAGTKEARNGDYTRFKAALSSGAHFISTDYYKEDKKLGTGYKIKLPEGVVVRCNPMTLPKDCLNKIEE